MKETSFSTCVWILLRPLHHRTCPFLSSISAWSISSRSSISSSSSSGISSFWVPWPAVIRNFRWLVGMVEINCGSEVRKTIHHPVHNFKSSAVKMLFKAYLPPEKRAKAKEDTPQPLLNRETYTAERLPSKLHDYNLKNKPRWHSEQLLIIDTGL